MQVSVESGEGLQRRMTVQVPGDQLNTAVEKRLRDLARTIRIDGFRPGKVPLKVLRQRYGNRVKQEAYGEIIQSTFAEAAKQESLLPAGEPRIEVQDSGDAFGYVAEFEVMPEIALADLGSTTVAQTNADVTDSDVDKLIEKLRHQRSTWNTVTRAAADGDQLFLSFVGTIEGEPFQGGSGENVEIVLGSNSMIEGFEQGLLGVEPQQTRKLDLQFPEKYHVESLAGKPVVFDVSVDEVREPVLPEVDEDFARAFGVEDGSIDGLRADVRNNMERELKQKLHSINKERVMQALLDSHGFEAPQVMTDQEAARLKQRTREEMERAGRKSNVDLPLEVFKEQAERRVKLGLLVSEIARANNIVPDDTRLRALAEEYAAPYENPQEVVNYYLSDNDARASLRNVVLEDQVVEWAADKMQVSPEGSSFDDIM
ncbi:MAG: trigger factor [Pseudomonadota bacterium]